MTVTRWPLPADGPLCPQGSKKLQEKFLKISSTLYVGNLSFYTTEEQIQELFSKCGDVKRIVMGLDKIKKTPCGFCFVEYPSRALLLSACHSQLCHPTPVPAAGRSFPFLPPQPV